MVKGSVEKPASTLLRCYKLQACEPVVIVLVCQCVFFVEGFVVFWSFIFFIQI